MSANVDVFSIPQQTSEAFMLTSGTSGYIETNWIPTTKVIAHSYLRSRIYTPAGTSITYAYTLDGNDYSYITDLTNLDIPVQVTQIKIRITLSRNLNTIPSPAVNVFKYRMQIREPFKTYDSRFDISIPAFLASKQYKNKILELKEQGQVTTYQPSWWALPDVKISERDIGMFLVGNHQDQRFEFQQISISEHAVQQRVLHTNWESRFIFAKDDVLGIVYELD
jgi:hypothetical protein